MSKIKTICPPLISIIVVAYNAENTMARCLDSIVGQSLRDFELIIVNDGSTDGTQVVIDHYKETDSRILSEYQPNSGVGVARQRGLDLASGLFTIYVDADDWIEKDMMDLLYNKATQESSDIIICDFDEKNELGTFYRKQEPKSEDSKEVLGQMLSGFHGSLCNKLIYRSLYIKSGTHFVKGLNFCEDECVVIRLLSFGCKVSYVNRALYHYDKTANSDSFTNLWHSRQAEEYELFVQSCAPYLDTPQLKRNLDNRIAGIIKKLIYAPDDCFPENKAFYLRHKSSLWKSGMSMTRKVFCWLFYNGFRWIKKFGNVHLERT